MPQQLIRMRAIVEGRVQGVWFRQSTADAVAGTDVAGWVRNLDDGRVEAVFEGPQDAVTLAVDYVSHGPEHARVDDIQVSSEKPEGLTGFHVC